MTARRIAVGALAAVAVAVTLVVAAGDEQRYRVRLVLDSAYGLNEGGEVRTGGVAVGRIGSLRLGKDDAVVADLEIDEDAAPIGKGAAVAIRATNLLGQKFVDLDPGDPSAPRPSGTTVPGDQIDAPTDLDQVLDVLDADTRTRLQILINEAGIAVTGRRADFNAFLRGLPPSLVDLRTLLDGLNSDGRALGRLVEHSDGLIARIARERRELGELVQVAGHAARTVAERRAELRQSLAKAPATLRALQGFLADLEATAEPLGPAARAITDSAPALHSTLEELEPFRRAASPTLEAARTVAPRLTRLADGATPVLRRAVGAVGALAEFGERSGPLTRAVDVSIDDTLATLEGWARAIQLRDGLSHSFRAKASVSADTLRTLVSRLQLLDRKRLGATTKRRARPARPNESRPAPEADPPATKLPDALRPLIPKLELPPLQDTVKKLTGGLTLPGGRRAGDGSASRPEQLQSLLDFLLAP